MKVKIGSKNFEVFRDDKKVWRVAPHYHEISEGVEVDKNQNFAFCGDRLLNYCEEIYSPKTENDSGSCRECAITDFCDKNPLEKMYCSLGNGRTRDQIGHWEEIPMAEYIPKNLFKTATESKQSNLHVQTDLEKEIADLLL